MMAGGYAGAGGGMVTGPGVTMTTGRAGAGGGACAGNGACAEGCADVCCEGTGGVVTTGWQYVGQGRGDYAAAPSYNYTGQGAGDWERVVTTQYSGWRCKPCCIALPLLLLLLPLLYFLMRSMDGDEKSNSVHSQSQIIVTHPSTVAPVNCHDTTGWDKAKQAFCCKHFHMGCPETTPKPTAPPQPVPVPTPQPFVPPPAPVPITSLPFDCAADWTTCYSCLQHRWSIAKREWCCVHARRGCTTPPPPQPTSAPYDCFADYTTCHHCLIKRWSISKRNWCCTNANKGCSTLPAGR